ncbi:hypothetical protein [Polyangium aurulentum]|uniref:hypothetical protein n=1 Tax=Polyangium aurulentum TaxID=2567896 RepID=UPI00197FC0E3|nr:hypothetical protein [Polyangium aurulentum]UQA56673.1 hypothetical protein E8A73_036015 [Polyangium aurulentum]
MARSVRTAPSFTYALVFVATALALGCNATNGTGTVFSTGGDGGGGSGAAGGGGTAGGGTAGGGTGGEGGSFIPPDDDGGGIPEPTGPAEVYGHSSSTLYKLNPDTKEVVVIGTFKGCSSVIDLALDADSNIIATTFNGLYRIDKVTAQCTTITSGSYPNSLSFVPKGTLDPNVEALVGYQGSTYVRIDPVSGQVTTIGQIGGGYSSSGDIVSVKGGGTYLTVKGQNCNDCLIEVDPKTGAMVKNWGSVGYGSVFGIAFWAGSVYGFSDSGDLFEITFAADKITTTPIPTMSGLSFWGAGSTTSAPVVPPPK